jgi:hypothetical protein
MAQESTSGNTAEIEDPVQHTEQDTELAIPNEKENSKKPKPLSAAEEDDAVRVYPPAREVIVVMIALYLSLFLVSLVIPPHSFFSMQLKH